MVVTYKSSTNLNGPTINLRKSRVLYITLESGTVFDYSNRTIEASAKRDSLLSKLNRYKNSIKWEVLSSLTNDICLGYERHLFRNQSMEFKVAYIGVGNESVDEHSSSNGFFLKFGYKFIQSKRNSIASFYGSYLKPELGYSNFIVDQIHFSSTHLILNYGVQTLLVGRAVVELYGGLGISYNDYPTTLYVNGIRHVGINRRYFYSNSVLGGTKPGFSACISGGLVLSFLF